MSEIQAENDLTGWVSTYGLVTIQRLLDKYQIKLSPNEIIYTLKTPETFYHRLLRVPLRNIFNGIILQQARDYQLYAQKMFIDFLISPDGSKDEEGPGGGTRYNLEELRTEFVKLNEQYAETETAHKTLIVESQRALIEHAANWNNLLKNAAKAVKGKLSKSGKSEQQILRALIALLTQYEFKTRQINDKHWSTVEQLLGISLTPEAKEIFSNELHALDEFAANTQGLLIEFAGKINDMAVQLKGYRGEFKKVILRAKELIQLLPEYRVNEIQDQENKEALYFDSELGGSDKEE
ncbi:hypothetical protein ACFORL_00850 [Legionella dresdenensis]|uniref:Uncharacterized protein n=1 Tax=Legionella dresdenensis TaxID=450200 RepID=A0ABV8CBL4_9GAMM